MGWGCMRCRCWMSGRFSRTVAIYAGMREGRGVMSACEERGGKGRAVSASVSAGVGGHVWSG